MSKIITVFGATGNQGGSVIRALLADTALAMVYKIRAVTRDTQKPAAKELAGRGVELVKADMSSPEAVAPAVTGAHTVFLVTNFWESMDANVELSQGKAVADACKAAGVEHIVFSSLLDVSKASGGRLRNVRYFDVKAHIEEYINKIGLRVTGVQPGYFMSNFFTQLQKGDDGAYTFALPEGLKPETTPLPLFEVNQDMGKFVKAAIKNFPAFVGKHIYAATDYYSPQRMLSEFSAVTGKPSRAQIVSHDVYKSFLPPPAAQDLLENMLMLWDPGYYVGADLAESLALLDEKPTTWREFVETNKQKWL